jgi:ATP-dependent Lon protease
MEELEIAGYTEEEKLQIATIISSQAGQEPRHDDEFVRFTPELCTKVIRGYTREAGVRNLEREIGALCRKVARREPKAMSLRDRHARCRRANARCGRVSSTKRWRSGRRIWRGNRSRLDAAGGEVLFIEASRWQVPAL